VLVVLELKVSARCDVCSVLTPMVGIRNRLSCRNCAASIDFKAKVADSRDGGLRYPFGGYYDAVAEAALVRKPGEDCQDARDSQGSPTALRKVAAPECPSCARPLEIPARGMTSLRCGGCHDVVGVRWPDDETRDWDPRITCIVGDGLKPAHEAREARTQGQLISCGQCGAPLTGETTDHRRARTCAHCDAVNYLGDAAMLALFPEPTWYRSFLVYQLDERAVFQCYQRLLGKDNHAWLDDDQEAALRPGHEAAMAAARARVFVAARRGEAEAYELEPFFVDKALSDDEAAVLDGTLDDDQREKLGADAAPALLRRWATSRCVDLRRLVAAHPTTGRDQLIALAADPEAAVRATAAARPELPPDLLARLRKDTDEAVARAVKENPSYKPGFLERLFG